MNKIQLLIPMAGNGQRFKDAGYETIKPLIELNNQSMINIVVKNLISPEVGHLILVTKRDVLENSFFRRTFDWLEIPVTIVCVDELTQGPAMTVLSAWNVIDNELPLVIANSDQYIDASLEVFYKSITDFNCSGSILTMQDKDPKWSYVKLDTEGNFLNIKEKIVISDNATVGVYGFGKAVYAFNAINAMIKNKDLTNNEYYVAPCYNYFGDLRKGIKIIDLGPISKIMHGLGTPKDLEQFAELKNMSITKK